jgi:hypothetical protein
MPPSAADGIDIIDTGPALFADQMVGKNPGEMAALLALQRSMSPDSDAGVNTPIRQGTSTSAGV